jgi:choline monooxygenase
VPKTLQEKLNAFDPNLPLARALTIPADWYFDPGIYAAECRSVFGGTWQAACRLDQLRERGAFATLEIAGEPIVVLRDENDQLRAFINVCRHRAARVVCESAGKASKLRCRYHGWTYDLAGRLRGAPEFDGVENFVREEQGLPEIEVDTWGPYIWVRMPAAIESASTEPLKQFLAPMPEQVSTLGSLHFYERREYELDCNWKVYVDNYLDGGYHVNTIHPGLAGVLDYSQYRTTVAGNTAVQSSPLQTSVAEPTGDLTGQVRTGKFAYYWWIFPNFMLNLYEGLMDVNLVLPLGQSRCRVIFDFYFADVESREGREFAGRSVAVAEQIQMEDMSICADVQRGLPSRSFAAGRFSVRREAAGYHFHQLLARRLHAAEKSL